MHQILLLRYFLCFCSIHLISKFQISHQTWLIALGFRFATCACTFRRGYQLTDQNLNMADRQKQGKLFKSTHHHLWWAQSKKRQAILAHSFTEVSELFSLTRFTLLRGEFINYMTSTPSKRPWFVNYYLKLLCTMKGKSWICESS